MAEQKKRGRPKTAHMSPIEKAVHTIKNTKDLASKYASIRELYKEVNQQVCIMQRSDECRKTDGFRKESDFYTSKSPIFHNSRVPICKDCLKEYCTNEDGTINTVRLLQVLPIVDKPYRDSFLEIAEKSNSMAKNMQVSEYFRVCNFPQNANLAFSDSDGTLLEMEQSARSKVDPLDIVVTDELRIKWGTYMEDPDIRFLQYKFEQYITYYSVNLDDPVQTGLVEDLCHQDLKLRQARENNRSEKEIIAAKQDLLKTANLSPTQTSKTNTGFSIGGWIKEREETSPISEPKDEFKDPDGIYEIFSKFFGHIVKMMGLSKTGIDDES